MGMGHTLTKFVFSCEWCGLSVYRRVEDHRAIPPPGERTCGTCRRPKGMKDPTVELVVLGKCLGCGVALTKPAHRRGRNPRYCPKCRGAVKFASPQHMGGKRPTPSRIDAKGPPVVLCAGRAREARVVGTKENARISRIKAVVGGKARGRPKGVRRG
jgi:hypothetical protein